MRASCRETKRKERLGLSGFQRRITRHREGEEVVCIGLATGKLATVASWPESGTERCRGAGVRSVLAVRGRGWVLSFWVDG
jgi:hypothetical protein